MIVRFNTEIVQGTIWKALKEAGWTTVQVKEKRQRHFHTPKKAKKKKAFDSCMRMINFVREEPEWKANETVSKALAEYDKFVNTLPLSEPIKRTKSGSTVTLNGSQTRKRKTTNTYSPVPTMKRRRMTTKDFATLELPILKCDLLVFWDTLWVTLEELGWTMEVEKKKKFYLRPVTKNRNAQMESGRQVLDYVRTNPEWSHREPVKKALLDYEKALEKKGKGKTWKPTKKKKKPHKKETPKKTAPTPTPKKRYTVKKALCAHEGCEKQSQGNRFEMMCWSHFRAKYPGRKIVR